MIHLLNFLVLSIFSLFIILASPDFLINKIIFFLIVFLVIFINLRVFIGKFKVSLLLSLYFVILLVLQLLHLLNPLNTALVAILVFIVYITS